MFYTFVPKASVLALGIIACQPKKQKRRPKMGVQLVIPMLTYMSAALVARFLVQIDGTEACSRVESVI